jgi:hypothetical protein
MNLKHVKIVSERITQGTNAKHENAINVTNRIIRCYIEIISKWEKAYI